MPIVMGGTNYRTSPLWLREKAALAGVRIFNTRKRLLEFPGVKEVAVISTCNRVEFYAAGPDQSRCQSDLKAFFSDEYKLSDDLDDYFYFTNGKEAAKRLFSVTCGADSMVLGECQVMGQVSRSFDQAREEGSLGPELDRLCRAALDATLRIRSETCFGKSPVSIGSVAVEMAKGQLGALKNRAAMILGAGEMGIVTARALSAYGVATILVTNRTLSRAQEVAHSLGGKAVDYSELESQIMKVDVLVASTSAPHVLVKKAVIERLMESRPSRQMFIIDLAVPRNVDERASQVQGVSLVNVDDLQEVADRNSKQRMSELECVNAIIEQEAEEFIRKCEGQGMSLMDLAL